MFHETLTAAVAAAIVDITPEAGFNMDEAVRPFETGGIPYPQKGADKLPCVCSDFPLLTYKGRPTKKHGHIQIWRHDSGRYESNSYVL